MRTSINKKSDFDFIVLDNEGNAVDMPTSDFTLDLWTWGSKCRFRASSIGGVLKGCRSDNGKLRVYVDNPGFVPGKLVGEWITYAASEDYADGSQRTCRYISDFGIDMVDGDSTTNEQQVLAMMQYIQGASAYEIACEHGYQGTEEEWLNSLSLESVNAANECRELMAQLSAAEDVRNANEQDRANAEASRVIAETNRESAETDRADAEASRVTAERNRESAETDRADAESIRLHNEEVRQAAENYRITHENSRESNETMRQNSETARVTAEQDRADAEASRAAAEEERKRTHDGLKTAMREYADAESLRDEAEAERREAEQYRIEYEQSRQSSEATRATNERNRATAEQQRVTNETARSNAESSRATAENARQTAEADRQEAEQGRVTAEQQRADAEAARAEEFATFEGKIAAKEDAANKVTSINADADDVHYPSAKAVLTAIQNINSENIVDGAVTLPKLSTELQAVINNVAKNASFAGIATPATNPGTPDGPVFYLASQNGVYANFNGIKIIKGEVAILQWNNGSWSKESLDIIPEIVNDLTTGGAEKALSAEMGKELGESIDDISLNLIEAKEMVLHKEGLSIPSSVLQYLGKTPCKFIVSGGTNKFNITGQNKNSGSVFILASVDLVSGEDFIFENPRPDIEFIDIRLQGISSTDKTKKVNLSIVKSNELLHSLKRIDKISEDVFNTQENVVFRTRFSCEENKVIAPITVNGECVFDFLSEVDTSFFLMGVNTATGTNLQLALITLAANETLTLKNPRPDLNLKDFSINVISTTNTNGYVDLVISKPNYLSDKIEYNTRELSSVKENFSVDEELTFDLSAGLIYTANVGDVQSTVKTGHNAFISNVYKVAQGDRIILSGKGGDGARLYAITNNSYVVTKLAPVNNKVANEEIIIPEDGHIVINVDSTVTYSVVRKSIKPQTKIEEDIDYVKELVFFTKDNKYCIKRIYPYRGGISVKVDCNIAVGDKYTIKLKTTAGGYKVNLRFYGERDDFASLSITQGTISEYTNYSQKDYSGFTMYFSSKAGMGNAEVEVIIEKHKSFAWHNMFGIQCDCKFNTPPIPYFSKPSDKTYCEYFYSLYDDLVSRFPQYVTKVDCDEEVVAVGIERDPILEEQGLPIYMYKFIPSVVPDSSAVTDIDGDNKRLKVYIQTGIHPEYVAIWDTYQMMRLICEEWENDTNLEELRWNVEFYIIPCIAPWCVNNTSRVNQNGVNINRNAPTINWTYIADDGSNYSGEAAADQYETKVMMYYIESIKPHIGIDHHNSNSANKKAIIYTSCVWQKGVDISSAHISYMTRKWKKNMDVFPTNTEDPVSMFGFAGFNTEPNTVGMYICEQGALGYTYESCDAICYRNGVYTPDNPIRNTDEVSFTATDGFIHFILFCCKKF